MPKSINQACKPIDDNGKSIPKQLKPKYINLHQETINYLFGSGVMSELASRELILLKLKHKDKE